MQHSVVFVEIFEEQKGTSSAGGVLMRKWVNRKGHSISTFAGKMTNFAAYILLFFSGRYFDILYGTEHYRIERSIIEQVVPGICTVPELIPFLCQF